MSELVKTDKGQIVGAIHKGGGDIALPVPFERDIFLFDTHVAGTTRVPGIEDLEPHLHDGDRLTFRREPENPHDKLAIAIRTANGVRIGYVPRDDNPVFARLMDAGKQLFGEITGKEMVGNWLKIRIKVYLHE